MYYSESGKEFLCYEAIEKACRSKKGDVDYCLPNIVVQNIKISGFIDVGRGGVADKYQDVALAVRSIRYNLKPEEFVNLFFEEYGLKDIDFSKIEYYILLDELF